VDSLGADDPTEVAVREWFAEDLALAERYLETQDEAVTATRTTARERVRAVVQAALDSVQGEARAIIEPTGELPARAANCQGAIFIRNAVLEACATQESPLCGPAAEAGTPGDFRFVDAPADLWDIQQLRPWTDPGRLQVGPDGQVVGARTSGFARFGNVVLSVALEPLLARRTELTADQVARFQAVIDTLGFEFASEEYVFAPALSLRANLEDPLADETHYMLHFGAPDSADVVWTGPAGSGTPVDAGIIPSPGQVQRLAAGEPLSLTAIRQTGEGEATAVYTLELTVVNQARASNALLGYMAAQLSRDLASLLSG
jgi:hypothetical protein